MNMYKWILGTRIALPTYLFPLFPFSIGAVMRYVRYMRLLQRLQKNVLKMMIKRALEIKKKKRQRSKIIQEDKVAEYDD